jgi:hypothetical protein
MDFLISASPPRPRQAVHIGAIGHRLNRIAPGRVPELRTESSRVLQDVLQLSRTISDPLVYSAKPPMLRVISPLAEGADRIVAQAGLDLGAELQCPLPFHVSEYVLDFGDERSRQDFYALLANATAVFELDGSRENEGIAYELAGRLVIAQSDLILAIWDGQAANGPGGTAQMIEEAVAQGVPVVWLHATESLGPCVIELDEFGKRQMGSLQALQQLFQRTPAKGGEEVAAAQEGEQPSFYMNHAYCKEKHPWLDGSQVYKAFRDFVVKGSIPSKILTVRNFEEAAREEWDHAMPADLPMREFLLERLCPYYAWADGLSNYYSGLLRSSSIASNLLSAVAVFCALWGTFLKEGRLERLPTVCELGLICGVIGITFYGRGQRWHERWLNYRQLGERIRQYFGQDPTRSWVDGTFHAIVRDVGLAPATVSHEYLASIGALLNEVLADQVKYHDNNHSVMERLTERLHLAGTALFGVTLMACMAHLLVPPHEHPWLLLLATVPPAFGAAFYGISNHGEFARSADRSAAMREVLNLLRTRDLARALRSGTGLHEELRVVASRVADTMIAETLDWNAVFRYRPLNLP